MPEKGITNYLWYERHKPKDMGVKNRCATYVDAKLDGWMLDIGVPPTGHHLLEPITATRTDDLWYRLKHLRWVKEIVKKLDAGTAVTGELYVPGEPASAVPHIICSEPTRLQFAAFAISCWKGTQDDALDDMDLFLVEAALRQLGCKVVPRWRASLSDCDAAEKAMADSIGMDTTAAIHVSPQEASRALQALRDRLAANTYIPSQGYAPVGPGDAEGIVLKEKHLTGWWKFKETRAVDLIATAMKEGNGRNAGLVGSITGSLLRTEPYCENCSTWELRRICPRCGSDTVLRCHLVEVADVGGMSDEVRENTGDEDIGRVFEAEYQYLGSGDRLRHPRFKRWRDDKPREQCTWDQVLNKRGVQA